MSPSPATIGTPAAGSLSIESFIQSYETAIGHGLNAEQRTAIRHGQGPLFLMAGPGSGKTEVIVARALKLFLVDAVPSGAILITTFTEKAARNLSDRITDRLIAMGYSTTLDDLRVGTMHSLCDRIMREYRYPAYYHTRLLNDTEQGFFIGSSGNRVGK